MGVTLPTQFNRRIEDDSIVLWRPGFTIWIEVCNNDKAESQQERLDKVRDVIPPDAFDTEVVEGDAPRVTHRLTEHREEGVVHALYAFVIGVDGHVQMAIYFDNETDLDLARQIANSLTETRAS